MLLPILSQLLPILLFDDSILLQIVLWLLSVESQIELPLLFSVHLLLRLPLLLSRVLRLMLPVPHGHPRGPLVALDRSGGHVLVGRRPREREDRGTALVERLGANTGLPSESKAEDRLADVLSVGT